MIYMKADFLAFVRFGPWRLIRRTEGKLNNYRIFTIFEVLFTKHRYGVPYTAAEIYVSAKEKVDKLEKCPTQNFLATILKAD
jgi:hypothetical protein